MAPTYRVERDRGSKEFPEQLVVLRESWPLAFPTKHEVIRPLAAVVKPKPAQTRPTETPEQLRNRVRAGLLRRRA